MNVRLNLSLVAAATLLSGCENADRPPDKIIGSVAQNYQDQAYRKIEEKQREREEKAAEDAYVKGDDSELAAEDVSAPAEE